MVAAAMGADLISVTARYIVCRFRDMGDITGFRQRASCK
jgi:hypothetical protein